MTPLNSLSLPYTARHAPVPLAVSRVVPLATELAAPAVAVLRRAGPVQLTEPFQASAWVPHAWRARGRLTGVGRGVRVEVAVDGGPGRPVELSIRPLGRRAHLWGGRRLQRYFAAANPAADELGAKLRRIACPASVQCADTQVTLAA